MQYTEYMLEFGERLKNLRNEKGLSQEALAELLDVSSSIISRWEQGKSEPTASKIKLVTKFFNVTSDYMLGNIDEWGNIEAQYPDLKPDEQNILTVYKKLNNDCKQNVLQTMELFARNNKSKK